MSKKDNEHFTKCWICDNGDVDCDTKVRDHCHITGNIEALRIEIVISVLD